TTLFDEEANQHTMINNKRNNMNNIESNRNMYDILPQEEVSSTKESWDDMVSQHKNYLRANTSVQETDNGQNNNKTHDGTHCRKLRIIITQEIREAKFEEVKDATVPVYAKSETYAQDITQNVWSEAVNMNTTNPKEATINMVSNIELPTSPSVSNSWIAEREPHDEPTLDNPYSEQYPEENISTRSSDIVMETVEKKVEFTTVVNRKKKKNEKNTNKFDPTRPSPYKKIQAGVHSSSTA
ncbi:18795_t:CDS:2, partial [Gigaspora margarita]